MADKAITDLNVAPTTVDDNNTWFAVAQSGTAYKLSGHEFILALGTVLNGHGGINSIVYTPPVSPSLTGSMVITLADNSTTTVSVENGKGISSIAKTGTLGLVDTYTVTYNDATTSTFTVTNGAKGDQGDAWYVHIRYAGAQPTADSDMGTTPDDWIGIYSGTSSTAPVHYTDYDWFKFKGDTGATGAASSIQSTAIEYQESTSGTVVPQSTWTTTIPVVAQGNYLWTRTTVTFNSGNPVVWYSVAHSGLDGTGAVTTVNSQSPDGSGNVSLLAANIPTNDSSDVQTKLTNIASEQATQNGNIATLATSFAATYSSSANYAVGDYCTYNRTLYKCTSAVSSEAWDATKWSAVAVTDEVNAKQDTLVSGTNIKTINGTDILGSGNISITSGVSSVNTKTGTVVLDADDVGAMYEWDLLWTNASPSSSFSAQTISLDLTNYSMVLILYYDFYDGSGGLLSTIGIIDSPILDNRQQIGFGWWTTGRYGVRTFKPTTTGIEFGACNYNNATNNSDGVPYLIYGIKGVA